METLKHIINIIGSLLIGGSLVALTWCGIVFLLGFASGWRTLARMYPDIPSAEMVSEKPRVYMRLGRLANYNGVTTLEATNQGLRFKVNKLFRIGNPTFLIPWSDLNGPQNNTLTGSIFPNIIFISSKIPKKQIKFTRGTADWIQEQRQKFSSTSK